MLNLNKMLEPLEKEKVNVMRAVLRIACSFKYPCFKETKKCGRVWNTGSKVFFPNSLFRVGWRFFQGSRGRSMNTHYSHSQPCLLFEKNVVARAFGLAHSDRHPTYFLLQTKLQTAMSAMDSNAHLRM